MKQQWIPAKYQLDAAKFFLAKKQCMLWLDPGLGKTSITLAAFKILLQQRRVKKILVVAPLRVCQLVWGQEIEKWADFSSLTYTILHGAKKEASLHHDVNIYIINYEGLAWIARRWATAPVFDAIVYDEISKLKQSNTKRFKILKSLIDGIPYRLGLTGSPASKALMGLFSQFYAIDSGKTFGRYITHFRSRYFFKEDYSFTWELLPQAEDNLYKACEPLVMRLKAEDYIDMPKLIKHKIIVELPSAAREIYDGMEKDFLAEVAGGLVSAANTAVKTGKLKQIASGNLWAVDECGTRTSHNIHEAKIKALLELIDELQGKPLLILYEFRHELDRLLEALGKDTPCLGSGIPKKRVSEIQDLWNSSKLELLLGQPQSMGHGLNLQGAANHVCFYTTPWSFELYDQTIRRLYRRGNQHSHVFAYHLIAKDTIDEAVLYNLSECKGRQDRLMYAVTWYLQNK